jgi:phosphoglycerate dehydrogenase-like enzyme
MKQDLHIAIVGFGEVGTIFARELKAQGVRISFYDILLDNAATRGELGCHRNFVAERGDGSRTPCSGRTVFP